MAAPYVPLRIFSCYSMLEGAIEPKAIAKAARKNDFPAAAITDRNGLYAAMAFTDACIAEGVQPIVGAMLAVARPGTATGKAPVLDWLALYAQNDKGYQNLCALVSAAHLGRPIEDPAHVAFEALEGRTDGLIALTAGAEGALARLIAEEQETAARDMVDRLEALFPGRLYVELCRRGDEVEQRAEVALIDCAYARDLPLVATNPARFVDAHFHAAHDAMLCIAQSSQLDRDDRERSSPEAWIKPPAEMRRLFEDLPEAIENSAVIARRCAFGAPKRKPILPSIAGDLEAEAEQLRADARSGLEARLAEHEALAPEERKAYFDRLDFEVDVIAGMGFPGYFLIVADFIKWAKEKGIPVGPGRGSGAGSVVAWALTITDLDPIRLGLLFERFLNPERVSMPDFDIDFCVDGRERVIDYVQTRYGEERVAQIITFGTLLARGVLRDVGRVLEMPYGQVDKLTKLVPQNPANPVSLKQAIEGEPRLQSAAEEPVVARLLAVSQKLEGLHRHASTHAAGVVIGDRPLEQVVPLYRDPKSGMRVTQFNMKWVEQAGLVKFDFLGLKTLTVLKTALDLIKAKGVEIDLAALPLDDPKTYETLCRGETVGIFQVESAGMRKALVDMKADRFEDIIALVALYRPGPMANIPVYCARKLGNDPEPEASWYLHPKLAPILKETYGI
ncbi:MAG TPA: DNA polymerase III subunit alpha, partial [Allosphingosinicella sp.]